MNIETTFVIGIVCLKCGIELPMMLMSEHLDINNPKNKMCDCRMMLENQQRRLDVVCRWAPFLLTLCRAGKGKRTRSEWMGFIQHGARIVFETEEEEYQYINKFGRGRWSEEILKKGFTQKEIEMIVVLAKEYGAFDY